MPTSFGGLSSPSFASRGTFFCMSPIVYFDLSSRPRCSLARGCGARGVARDIDPGRSKRARGVCRDILHRTVATSKCVHSTVTIRAFASRGSLQKHATVISGKVQRTRFTMSTLPRVDRTYCSEFPFVRWHATRNGPARGWREKSDRQYCDAEARVND